MLKSLSFGLQPIIKLAKPVTLSENRNYFPSIDILRGFAALSVVVYHVIEHFKWIDFPTQGPLVWFRIGWMGVDLFFCYIGFRYWTVCIIRNRSAWHFGFPLSLHATKNCSHRTATLLDLPDFHDSCDAANFV